MAGKTADSTAQTKVGMKAESLAVHLDDWWVESSADSKVETRAERRVGWMVERSVE